MSVLGLVLKSPVYKNGGHIGVLYARAPNRNYGSDMPTKVNMAAWKRGTGGRSSFNGVVATVFGATGNLGHVLINRLGKIGTQMIVPYRCDFYRCMDLKPAADLGQLLFQPFDLKDEESILKATKYSNVVINLIGREWATKNYSFDDVHVEGARAIARACKKNGVDRLIHVSYLNSAEHPEPIVMKTESGFKKSKWFGEQAVLEEFPDATIIKASDMFGGFDRFLRVFSAPWRHQVHILPLYKNGEATEKQPVFVSDVAQGIINAAKDPDSRGQIYQALGPNRYQLGEMVDWFHRVMKKTKEWGYFRYDMKYDPFFSLKVTLTDKLSPGYPMGYLHWEGLEKESTTDVIMKGTPTLEDLGVTLTPLEQIAPYELYQYTGFLYYKEDFDVFEEIAPCPTIPITPAH